MRSVKEPAPGAGAAGAAGLNVTSGSARSSVPVSSSAPDPAGARIEPDGALAADLRGIDVLGPLQAEIVEHRLDHAGARGIGGAVEVAGEAHLDVPASHEVAQDAAGRLDARLSGGSGGATCL